MNIVGLLFERFNVIRILPCAFYNVENGQRETNDRGIFLYYFFFQEVAIGFCVGILFFIYIEGGVVFFFLGGRWGRVFGCVYGVVETLWVFIIIYFYFYKR